jgi:hypothetical protein
MSRKLASRKTIARLLGVTDRTVTNYHIANFIVAYRVEGRRDLLFDVDEVTAEAARNPAMRTPSKVRGKVVNVVGDVSVLPEFGAS